MVKDKPKIIAIIQARMGSTRLPGKVLEELAGQPLLTHLVNRTIQAKTLDDAIVATTRQPDDDAIAQICKQHAWACFRGSKDDVLDRYYQAALFFKADIIVRLCADNPLIDPRIIDTVVEAHLDSSADYTYNGVAGHFPLGLDTEVFSFKSLEKVFKQAKQGYEHEHVTPYIYQHPEVFKIQSVEATGKLRRPDLRLTVDTEEDLRLIREIYKRLYREREIFYTEDIIDLLDKHPDLVAINAQIRQKTLGE